MTDLSTTTPAPQVDVRYEPLTKSRARIIVLVDERVVFMDEIAIGVKAARDAYAVAACRAAPEVEIEWLAAQLLDMAAMHSRRVKVSIGTTQESASIPGSPPAVITAAEVNGHVASPSSQSLVVADEPMRIAEHYLASTSRDAQGRLLLRYWAGSWWRYLSGAYYELTPEAARAPIYQHMDKLMAIRKLKDGGVTHEKMVPNSRSVGFVEQAMTSVGTIVNAAEPPVWLTKPPAPMEPTDLMSFANGILHVPTRTLLPPSPDLFTLVTLPFDYDPTAPKPAIWLDFLRDLWGDDADSIATLQEWFGYCLTTDTSLQKLLLLLGPKRSGKGTIAKVLRALIGDRNVAALSLTTLAMRFGLQDLLGKTLAIVADARLSGRTDLAAIVELLLTITGEDPVPVDRKNKPPISVKLGTRLMVISNELPKLTDGSGAFASRCIILALTKSFFGVEDPLLFSRIKPELPGILLWSLTGLDRLRQRTAFVPPSSTDDLVEDMEELTSPIAGFVNDQCVVGPEYSVVIDVLYAAWKFWCAAVGREKPGTVQSFARDIKAALPSVKTVRPRHGEVRPRVFNGLQLRNNA